MENLILTDSKLTDEPGRISALKRYGVLDADRHDNFDAITSIVCSVLQVPICAVTLVDETLQWIRSATGLETGKTSRRDAFCHHTIRQRQPMTVNDATTDPRFASNPYVTGDPHIRSYAGAALVSPDGYQLGALCAIDHQPRTFDASQIALLERFSKLVVEQLELRTLAHRDFLTDALTRRAFCEAGASAVRQYQRDGTLAALLTFDLDHFKRINDSFGHAAGDQVLKAVAGVCSASLRPGDVFGRLGGEEFGILLSSTSFFSAARCAERLRSEIEKLTFAFGGITASFGLAMVADHIDYDCWLAAADKALYSAKRSGRNRWMAEKVALRAA